MRDILIPYGSYYRTGLSAFGQASLYLSAVVSFSFWFRSIIGARAWKYIHYTAFVAYGAALWHGITIGTDSRALWLLGLYLSTSLAVVFIILGLLLRAVVAYYLIGSAIKPSPEDKLRRWDILIRTLGVIVLLALLVDGLIWELWFHP